MRNVLQQTSPFLFFVNASQPDMLLLVLLLLHREASGECGGGGEETWSKRGSPSKDCAWASEHGPRCDAIGADGKFAYDVCCGCSRPPTLAPTPFCVDKDWIGDCEWVSQHPSSRCEEKLDMFAFEACCACPPSSVDVSSTLVVSTNEASSIFRFALNDLISTSTSPDNITIIWTSSTTMTFVVRISTKRSPQLVADRIASEVSNTTRLNSRLVYWSLYFGHSIFPSVSSNETTATWAFVDEASTDVPTPLLVSLPPEKSKKRTIFSPLIVMMCAILLCCCCGIGGFISKIRSARHRRLLVDDGVVVISTQINPTARRTSDKKKHPREECDDDNFELDFDAPNLVIDHRDETMQHVFYGRAEYDDDPSGKGNDDPPLIEESRIESQQVPCVDAGVV